MVGDQQMGLRLDEAVTISGGDKEQVLCEDSGFLLSKEPPLVRLPLAFEPWECLVDDLQRLILASQIRARVLELPLLSLSELQTIRELQRAHLVLSLIAHGYIVGMPKCDLPETLLPAPVAIPWFNVSRTLGLKPVVSYATLELANYKLINPQAPPSLENLAMLHTFSGSFDEAWFYLIPLAIEAAGAPALRALLQARQDISNKVTETLVGHLFTIEKGLESMTELLKRMYERNDPHIFWHRVRPYSGGSKNAKDLPNGLFFEGVTETDEYVNTETPPPKGKVGTWRMYAGASAGQSPLIHALDIGLQIQHQSVGSSGNNPMLEMRHYLSQSQRSFLESLEKEPGLRDYIQLSGNPKWTAAFNRVLEAYKGFRDQHIQLTTVYIIQQAIKERARTFEHPGNQGHETSPNPSYVGTGGTDLVQFLKQTRDETLKTQIAQPPSMSPN